MRVVVYPHDLAVGGSQINAIDLGAAVRDLGHEVFVYGIPGPLVTHVEARELEFIAAPDSAIRPAPQRVKHLRRFARRNNIDLIHGYEWPPCLDAYFGAHLQDGVSLVCTVLSMAVSPLVPRSIPLIMGTEDLARKARSAGHRNVSVLEPPIDVEADNPAVDGSAVRGAHGISPDGPLVVTVSRLAVDLKLDALERAIEAVGSLALTSAVQLLIVGGGEAEPFLRDRAAVVDRRCGRRVVHFAGEQLDPRRYYAAADVVLGMGSSALRAMAIGRPVVVQGEHGFSLTCEPDTIDTFFRQGFWGAGAVSGERPLAMQISRLLADKPLREELGSFGRRLTCDRFALRVAATRLVADYEHSNARAQRPRYTEAAVAAARAVRAEIPLHDPRRQRARRTERESRLGGLSIREVVPT